MNLSLKDSEGKYNLVSQLLHWFMGISIIAVFVLAFTMEDADPSMKPMFYGLHKGLGALVLLLMFLRLALRFYNRQKLPLKAYTKARILLPKISHWVMYFLMVFTPFSGWVFSSARGPVNVLGMFSLPPIFTDKPEIGHFMYAIHEPLGFTLLLLVVLHIASVLKQAFVDKLPVLRRMWPK